MTIDYTKTFKKRYKKLPSKIQIKFDERLLLFVNNPYHHALNNHSLSGKYTGNKCIDISGDLRALYYEKNGSVIVFGFIGTHSQLY